jgi:hypothetical protein
MHPCTCAPKFFKSILKFNVFLLLFYEITLLTYSMIKNKNKIKNKNWILAIRRVSTIRLTVATRQNSHVSLGQRGYLWIDHIYSRVYKIHASI